ncbi:MAG: MFS transporter [Chromatocurvus sp.]
MFIFSDYRAPWVAAVTVGLLFFVATTAFSAFSVPYLALASELSNDSHERTRILTYRMVFAVAGVVLGVGLAQPLVFQLGGDAAAWRTMACIMGAICLVAMLGTAYGVPRKQDLSAPAAPRRFLGRMSTLWHCKPFVFLTVTFFLQSLAQGTGTGVLGFVFIYAVEDTELLIPFILIMAASTLATQPIWLSLSIRWGKEPVFIAACVLWIANALTWLLLRPGVDVLVELPVIGALSTQDALVLLRGSVVGVSTGGFLLLTLSMLTDAIESQRIKDGSVDEGLFSGVFSAFEKLSYAVGPMISGIVLSVVGFQASTEGAIAQGPEAVRGIVLLFSVIPAAIFALGLAAFALYRRALAEALLLGSGPKGT